MMRRFAAPAPATDSSTELLALRAAAAELRRRRCHMRLRQIEQGRDCLTQLLAAGAPAPSTLIAREVP